MIDLTDGLATVSDGGLDKLILRSKSTLVIDETNVLALTDSDDELFIGGKKGSTLDVSGGDFYIADQNASYSNYESNPIGSVLLESYGSDASLFVQAGIEIIGASPGIR